MSATDAADRIRETLACGRPGCSCRSNGTTHCPAHSDHRPSLSVTDRDGRTLVKCFAGCEQAAVVAALRERRLWPDNRKHRADGGRGQYIPSNNRATVQPPGDTGRGITFASYATAKQLPVAYLKGRGLTDLSYAGAPAVRIPYYTTNGTEAAVQFRLKLEKDGNRDERFKFKRGDKPLLYGMERRSLAVERGYITIVEGASDQQTLDCHDEPAVGLPGANGWNEVRDAAFFDGIAIIYVVIEPDSGGDAVQRWVAGSRVRDRVRLVELGEHKDPSELYLADPARFRERWQQALAGAVLWHDLAEQLAVAERDAAWQQCRELAALPSILDAFSAAFAGLAVGERNGARLLFLALVSRLLAWITSVAVKGPSSGGKSYLTESVLRFFPPSSFYALSAMSERALAYGEEPLANRFLVLYEAAGMSGEIASYLLRSLLSEGRVSYETVEKTAEGLRARRIDREGPTGLIVTTTAATLHPENETRLLSITVTDTREQTAAVLAALAQDHDGAEPDFAAWHALQTWLQHGEHRVWLPYAELLAALVPPVAVRLRRDFRSVLNLIRAHALLHQATRERDQHGRIVADLDDYAVVRELVADIVSDGVGATVSPALRETVEAVARLTSADQTTTVLAVAKALGIDKSAASRRVRSAEATGYIRNLEDKRGRPAKLVSGDPLPDELEILPTVDVLRQRLHGCSDERGDTSPPPPRMDGPLAGTCPRCGAFAWLPAGAHGDDWACSDCRMQAATAPPV